MSKWSYNPAESVTVDGKKFHLTPDRQEFLSVLTKKYPNETSFTKEMIDETGYFPYWLKSTRYNFKQGSIFNLQPLLAVDNTKTAPKPVPVPVAPAPAVSNMPVAAQTQAVNLIDDNIKIVPEKMSNYVPFGHFKDVKGIILSLIHI